MAGTKKVNSAVSQYLASIGRKGGEAKVPKGTAVLTPEERQERAKRAAEARWGQRTATKKRGKRS